MTSQSTPPHFITLVILTGFSPMSLNMFLPSLTDIANDLATTYATASLAVSGYLAVTALLQLFVGPISDRIGRRPVILSALLVFVFASIGCALAENIETFLFFRMLQSGGVAGYTLSLAIVRDTRPEREAVSLIGYIGMAMAIAPMLAPMLGGIVASHFGWRAIFLVYATISFGLLIACYFDLGETRIRSGQPIQSVFAGTLALLKEPIFCSYALCGTFSVGTFYVFVTGAPLIAKTTFEMTATEIGVSIGSMTVGYMMGGLIAGRFGKQTKPYVLLIAGRVVACIGIASALVVFGLGLSTPLVLLGAAILSGAGNGMALPGSNAGAMSVRPDLSGTAAGLIGALIVAVGAIITAFTGPMIAAVPNPHMLFSLMLVTALLSLLSAVWTRHLKRTSDVG